jgi:multidrug efflux pump subunit AcrA (membrane-fusion protein)
MKFWSGALALLSAVVVVIVAGCGGREREAATAAAPVEKKVTVDVAPLAHRTVVRSIDVVGTLRGWEHVTVGAKREGRVVKVLHDMGDRVEPGALLVQLESEDADLEVQQADRQLKAELAKLGLSDSPPGDFDVSTVPAVIQAEVALNRAKQNLSRERALIQRGAGTMQDLQNAENDERGAEANLAAAILSARSTLVGAQALKVLLAVRRYRRAEMEIRAPVPSVRPEGITGGLTYAIAKRKVSEGQMLKQGDAVDELVIENPLRLWVDVPERHSGDVKLDQSVAITVAAHPNMTFEGKVARINPTVDDKTRTFQVEAVVPNNGGLLRPGGFAKAAIVTSRDSKAAVVPIDSVKTFAGVTKIFVVDDNKAHAIPVETGVQGKGWVEVIGALPAEAQVVTTGQARLAEGTSVVVRQDRPKAPTGGKEATARAAAAPSEDES